MEPTIKDKIKFIINKIKYSRQNRQAILTAPGGYGKSYLVKELVKYLQDKMYDNVAILGSTGIAAVNIGGETVHKFFQFGMTNNIEELKAYDNYRYKINIDRGMSKSEAYNKTFGYLKYKLQKTDFVIIDEVSMLSADIIDMIYYRLEQFQVIGVPILFVGDFLQLPPVKNPKMAFESKNWNPINFTLSTMRRNDNEEFTYILSKIRMGIDDKETVEYIKSIPSPSKDFMGTHLVATNKEAAYINHIKLSELSDKPFPARIKITYKDEFVNDKDINDFIASAPVPEKFIYKEKAIIMMVINDPLGEFVNGDIGVISKIDTENKLIYIKIFRTNKTIVINSRYRYTKYNIKVKGGELTYEPFIEAEILPFKVSFANNIHKSQSQSISHLHIDCKRIFKQSQFYVAMSRSTDPNNLFISNFDPIYIANVNKKAINYYKNNEFIDLDKIEVEDNKSGIQDCDKLF